MLEATWFFMNPETFLAEERVRHIKSNAELILSWWFSLFLFPGRW